MEVLIGIDIGTYSVKATAITSKGELLGSTSSRHEISIPAPGYAEQDAEGVWWNGLVKVIHELVGKGVFKTTDVKGIGVSTLSPCVLPLDENNQPLRTAILYGVDVRAGKQIERFNKELGDDVVLQRYGQRMSSQTAGPKILWMKENQPDIFQKARRFIPATTYMIYRLTGRWTLDRYVAPSYAPFFRMDTMAWDMEMIERYIGKEDALCWPDILWPVDAAGGLKEEAAQVLRLPAGIPVAAGSADALSEAVSGAAIQNGTMFIMYGSSIIFIATTKEAVKQSEMFWPSPGMVEGEWALAGGMSTAGSLVRWVMDEFYPKGAAYEDFFNKAGTSPPGSNGLVMLPYFSGERTPVSDPDARGIIIGLTLKHNLADISRAALEGVAYGIRHNVEEFEKVLGELKLAGAGGGVTNPLWSQIISDVCKKEQKIMLNTNAAIGDALMAGMGSGLLSREDMNKLAESIGKPQTIFPDHKNFKIYDNQYQIYKSLYGTTKELAHKLAENWNGR